MKNVYEAKYNNFTVRFSVRDGDMYVSKDDIFSVIKDFSPFYAEGFDHDEGLAFFADAQDYKAIAINDDEIGRAVNSLAVANLLFNLREFAFSADEKASAIGFPAYVAFQWYIKVMDDADSHFNRDIKDLWKSIKKKMDRTHPTLNVNITYSEGYYTAECDDLHLVTESKSLDEIQELVWDLAPDLIELNELNIEPNNLRLSFQLEQTEKEFRRIN